MLLFSYKGSDNRIITAYNGTDVVFFSKYGFTYLEYIMRYDEAREPKNTK